MNSFNENSVLFIFGLKRPQLICNSLSALKSWISTIWHPLLLANVCLLSQYLRVQYKKQGLGSNLTTCNQDNTIRLQKWNNCNQPRLHLQSVVLDSSYTCLLAACHSGSLFTFWITSLKSSIPRPRGLSRTVCFSFLNINCPTAPLSFPQNVTFCYGAHFPRLLAPGSTC